MSFTVYDAAIPSSNDALNSLLSILKKGQASPVADKLPSAKLYDDMLPLTFQVHVVCDTVQKMVARATGAEPQKWENNLSSFDDMYARIAQAQEVLERADKATINDKAFATVPLGMGPGKEIQIPSVRYIGAYGLPNIYFHLSMTYAIMRNQGVPLGKSDYLGAFMAQRLPKE
ncbi:helix-turn-helix domain-containing protein [Penicillium canescens]|uniref:Helix-turn-helix domain-containing protein n=1 Tax=Penicillium canescens TaxID=5083 RepID=A0AAD6I007_PENCN|nr:helix-turn-helix domain-containing protein [Penicillium canescens]KAJ6026391.1 helix-turn-helix domain-containing protein [Penicillium canescens]KAJ6039675.1 helix-turn-helix domain-containing protein [Penicillium canescens]KAJ6067970.1 helix-turn-helix domain-containing protein [Penicillium canescens]